jgi:hypothetical protein
MKKILTIYVLCIAIINSFASTSDPVYINDINFRDVSFDAYGNSIQSSQRIGDITGSGKAVVINFFTASFC